MRELESQRPRTRPSDVARVEPTRWRIRTEVEPLDRPPWSKRGAADRDAPRRGRGAPPPRPARRTPVGDERRLVIHVEDHGALRDAIRAQVERCSGLQYAALGECGTEVPGIDPLLAVNLLAKDCDPLEAICDARWGLHEPRAFTYLAAGNRGVIAGVTDIIAHPFSPDDCATRLLERPGGTQRLLMVSDKIEVMNEIRAVLNRVRCSTSVALDGRQAYDLVSMVKPDAILIDLTRRAPRASGW